MHSGGAQKSAQRSQPAQSDFFWVTTASTGLYVRQSTLLLSSAPRVGGILGASSAQACV